MRDGQGFAKRVTLETLESFAPLLQRAGRGGGAGRGRQGQAAANPELEAAEGLFGGTSIRVRRPRAIYQPRRQPATGTAAPTVTLDVVPIGRGSLVWKKSNLPTSDVQIPRTPNTAVTGGLRLTQAKFTAGGARIDQTTYFRNILFGHFPWNVLRQVPFKEGTRVRFDITILGQPYGIRELEISHKPSGEAGQANYTTILHWGDFGIQIRGLNLLGRTFNLYGPEEGTTEPFFIEIT